MLIEMNLDVRVGDSRTVCEVQIPCSTEVHSYTAGEPATHDCPGAPEEIEWSLVTADAVTVNGVEVFAAGSEVPLLPIMRRDMEESLLRDVREDRAVSAAGY